MRTEVVGGSRVLFADLRWDAQAWTQARVVRKHGAVGEVIAEYKPYRLPPLVRPLVALLSREQRAFEGLTFECWMVALKYPARSAGRHVWVDLSCAARELAKDRERVVDPEYA